MTDPLMVVCNRVADSPVVRAPSAMDKCSVCGAKIWLAASTSEIIASRTETCVLRCVQCAMPMMRDVKEIVTSKAQQRELLKFTNEEHIAESLAQAIGAKLTYEDAT